MNVSKEVVDLAETLVNSEPSWKKNERPSLDEVKEINVMEGDVLSEEGPYVEVCYDRELYKENNHASGTQELVVAFFPHEHNYEGLLIVDKNRAAVKTHREDKISDEMQQVYEVFTAVIGRLTYHGES